MAEYLKAQSLPEKEFTFFCSLISHNYLTVQALTTILYI